MKTYAYVNHGRWIADCPDTRCGNAVALDPKQATYHCVGGCNLIADIVWPVDVDDITQALLERPHDVNRNWAPAGHRQAIATGHPMGQTVAELREETREHEVVS